MSNIPGALWAIPGYDSPNHDVRIIDGKIIICPASHDGYSFPAMYWGTAREIAKELFMKCINHTFHDDGYTINFSYTYNDGYSRHVKFDPIRKYDLYYYPFYINFRANPIRFSFATKVRGMNGANPDTIIQDIKQEFINLMILIPFS